MELTRLDIAETKAGLAAKTFSAAEVTNAYLERIATQDDAVHAFVEVYGDEARATAKAWDGKKTDLPLAGIPIAIKDILLDAGHVVTAGSRILEKYRSPYSATAIERLRAAGAVILGRTNMDEFAMGSSTASSAWGPTKNPWDTARVPGGSSGGSAAAVVSDFCAGALGSDTGGSVRQPAALSGLVGLKPTYGRVSRYGLIALASSFDQIGPMTKTVADAATLLSVISGVDAADATTCNVPAVSWKAQESLKGVRIGIPKEYMEGVADMPIGPTIQTAIDQLRAAGAEIKDVSLPHASYALAVYYVLLFAEASSNLSRLDGIRFGPREPAETLKELYRETRGRLFGDEVRRRIMMGTYVLSAGYYDAYYRKAQEARTLLRADYAAAFKEVDLLVTPTSPTTAWKIGELMDDPLAMYLADIFTVSVNVAGLPALSQPCGLLDGLPVGLQWIAPHWEEGRVFAAASVAEKIFAFRETHRPKIVL
ncbi:Asp-tRNA(Asn)/Glu-tRNA(Gln) amidotransferase subunit GatA [Patescibacteria group bacterium]|nr:Asp-tRNA(Asn)/Glu-tRNA(Gln) amidotransferase subunit GatA [Patescibacteria group bacterium]